MFSPESNHAWTHPSAETVGEKKARKARERSAKRAAASARESPLISAPYISSLIPLESSGGLQTSNTPEDYTLPSFGSLDDNVAPAGLTLKTFGSKASPTISPDDGEALPHIPKENEGKVRLTRRPHPERKELTESPNEKGNSPHTTRHDSPRATSGPAFAPARLNNMLSTPSNKPRPSADEELISPCSDTTAARSNKLPFTDSSETDPAPGVLGLRGVSPYVAKIASTPRNLDRNTSQNPHLIEDWWLTRDSGTLPHVETSETKLLDDFHQIQELGEGSWVERSTTITETHVQDVDSSQVSESTAKSPVPGAQICSVFKPTPKDRPPAVGISRKKGSRKKGPQKKASQFALIRADNKDTSESQPPLDQHQWEAPTDWGVGQPPSPQHRLDQSPSPPPAIPSSHHDSEPKTSMQRYVREMGSKAPGVILHHVTSDESNVRIDLPALGLERQLWVLSAYSLRTLSPGGLFPVSTCVPGSKPATRILELFGSAAETFLYSSRHPNSHITSLSTASPPKELPPNVAWYERPSADNLPYQFAPESFHLLRASSLASMVSSTTLPRFFHECYRLLSGGALLEIRIIDSMPVNATIGPKLRTWFDDRLMSNLEGNFRITKPSQLLPKWAQSAGFRGQETNEKVTIVEKLQLPVAWDQQRENICDKLEVEMVRALWKDTWGGYVEEADNEPKWWWENKDIVQECLEHQTIFQVGILMAQKPTLGSTVARHGAPTISPPAEKPKAGQKTSLDHLCPW